MFMWSPHHGPHHQALNGGTMLVKRGRHQKNGRPWARKQSRGHMGPQCMDAAPREGWIQYSGLVAGPASTHRIKSVVRLFRDGDVWG